MTASSLSATYVNILKTIIGAGVLALPFAFRAQGVLLALSLLCVAFIATCEGIQLQFYCSRFMPAGKASFSGLANLVDPRLGTLFDATIAAKAFGVAVSYLVIAANLGPELARDFGFAAIFEERLTWIVISALLIGPVCYKHSLDALKYTSMAALVAVAYVFLLVLTHFSRADYIESRGQVRLYNPLGTGAVLQTLPIFVFAFTCAHNFFTAVNELEPSSRKLSKAVVYGSLATSFGIYELLGLCGYLSFGDKVGDNIVTMYPPSASASIARASILFLVLFSFPLQLHPCRESILGLYNAIKPDSVRLGFPAGASDENEHRGRNYAIATTALLLVSFTIAANVVSLELILSFVGATGSTAISFIFPGFLAYKLTTNVDEGLLEPEPALEARTSFFKHWLTSQPVISTAELKRQHLKGLVLMVFGIAVLILCLGSNFVRFFA